MKGIDREIVDKILELKQIRPQTQEIKFEIQRLQQSLSEKTEDELRKRNRRTT
jgi:hypothetical protein